MDPELRKLKQPTPSSFGELPRFMLEKILNELDVSDLCTCFSLNRYLRQAIIPKLFPFGRAKLHNLIESRAIMFYYNKMIKEMENYKFLDAGLVSKYAIFINKIEVTFELVDQSKVAKFNAKHRADFKGMLRFYLHQLFESYLPDHQFDSLRVVLDLDHADNLDELFYRVTHLKELDLTYTYKALNITWYDHLNFPNMGKLTLKLIYVDHNLFESIRNNIPNLKTFLLHANYFYKANEAEPMWVRPNLSVEVFEVKMNYLDERMYLVLKREIWPKLKCLSVYNNEEYEWVLNKSWPNFTDVTNDFDFIDLNRYANLVSLKLAIGADRGREAIYQIATGLSRLKELALTGTFQDAYFNILPESKLMRFSLSTLDYFGQTFLEFLSKLECCRHFSIITQTDDLSLLPENSFTSNISFPNILSLELNYSSPNLLAWFEKKAPNFFLYKVGDLEKYRHW